MRSISLVFGLALLLPPISPAQAAAQLPGTDVFILRSAEQLQSPHIVTYRVFEWTQTRGRWIFPDVGYYDTGYGRDQIWFTGAGLDMLHARRFDWSQEIYFSQEAGPESTNKRALWVWPAARYPHRHPPFQSDCRLSRDSAGCRAEVGSGTSTAPSSSGRSMRTGLSEPVTAEASARLEHRQSNPFATVTRKTHAGNFSLRALAAAHRRRGAGTAPLCAGEESRVKPSARGGSPCLRG